MQRGFCGNTFRKKAAKYQCPFARGDSSSILIYAHNNAKKGDFDLGMGFKYEYVVYCKHWGKQNLLRERFCDFLLEFLTIKFLGSKLCKYCAIVTLVSLAAVFSIVTQRSSPILKTAARETMVTCAVAHLVTLIWGVALRDKIGAYMWLQT